NVSVRNFTMKPAELVKKLKIKEGGDKRLYASKVTGNLKLIVALPAY
ncbi:MAG: SAM-dependent methyltransferase, partial [Paramuribaculum sp.]|nr:SAM-dependent methyltransferase [Paramuribaculum sp.]